MNEHHTLMATLQAQRDDLARLVTIFAPEEYKTLRTEAVDRLDLTQSAIQHAILYPKSVDIPALKWRIGHNIALLERLNAAVIAESGAR